ncbi:serine threonine-protein kinase [Coemansia sp. RSA 552]|nr:serine threonine-protein kinase [Coemansia sp. RSA 552]
MSMISPPQSTTATPPELDLSQITAFVDEQSNEVGQGISFGDYGIIEVLSDNGINKVCLAVFRGTEQKVVLKFMRLYTENGHGNAAQSPERLHGRAEKERVALSLFIHPNVIKSFGIMRLPRFMMVATEYVEEGTVADYIQQHGPLNEEAARALFVQMVNAVEFLHSHGVVHRNLKAEHLLLDSTGHIRLIGFSFSHHFKEGVLLDTYCGTPNYASPEMVNGTQYTGPEADVWSMGAILYLMLWGRCPFEGRDIKETYENIALGRLVVPESLTTMVQDLLFQMLDTDPKARASVRDVLRHPWARGTINGQL